MKYRIIANPAAGKGKAIALIERVRSMLKEHSVEFDIVLTKAPGDAADLARLAAEEGRQVVVSLGGDGTASEVIRKMFDGNINGRTPLEAKILPKAIDVLVPS